MKTKRVFFALLATLVLPLTAMAQIAPTPQPGTAVIAVSVFFNNGNTGDPATIRLQCSSGTISPTEVAVVNPVFGQYEHAFVVENIPLVPEDEYPGVDCWVTQDPIAGYETEYDCLFGAYSGLTAAEPDDDCNGYVNGPSDEYCHYLDVQPDMAAGCTVFNNAEFQEVAVTKKWDVIGTGGDKVDRRAEINISCNTYIMGGKKKGPKWRTREELYWGDYDEDGIAVVTAWVFPWWYPEDSDDGNFCWASEDDIDSYVEVESDCGDYEYPGMQVFVGQGDSCTITNTVFFEGIPTLNQYGMAIMALLMLGVGFVGFRRFV